MPYPMTEEERERRRREEAMKARQRIASTQVQDQQLQQKAGLQTPQGGGPGLLGQAGQIAGKQLLSSLLGPLGPLAGLFNKGGQVPMQGYNKGGWLTALYGKPSVPMMRNTGGPIQMRPPLANPNGYREGGSVQETPIKKVMDEQKLEQQAKAFELEQQRKQEAHDMAMKQKQMQFQQAQKLKKESATTTKKPKPPLAK